ncbi:MAG TPA: glycosyltransferase, partial [Candidatus Binatia bacterium]
MIEALRAEYDLSVLTWNPVDLEHTNRYFGTSLRASDFIALSPHPVLRRVLNGIPAPFTLLKMHLLLRLARRIRRGYDLLISASNEADLDCPSIQYVHFPAAFQPRPASDMRWYHHWTVGVNAYRYACRRISDYSPSRLKNNLTLVNSNWTGGKVRECHGIDSTTLYPPIAGEFPPVPWPERENGFVCVGRFAPEKELDKVIDIIAAVRSRGQDVHLHLIGGRDAHSSSYYFHIRRRIEQNASWVFLHEDIPRAELAGLVARHRYGIHGMSEEHFGMAVAEMVRAGCIVFVPRGGGQVEIVGDEERLLYRAPEEAAEKILQTLGDAERQRALREFLETRAVLFSTERFIARTREIVRLF